MLLPEYRHDFRKDLPNSSNEISSNVLKLVLGKGQTKKESIFFRSLKLKANVKLIKMVDRSERRQI